jgi:hypothetical protein
MSGVLPALNTAVEETDMLTKSIAGVLLFVAVLLGVALSARQVQSVPGPGSGVVSVTGRVQVSDLPPVQQAGTWRVAVDNTPGVNVTNRPIVTIAPLEFLKTGAQYAVTWTDGVRVNLTILAFESGSWARVSGGGRPYWVNLAAARSIDPL